jgi:hypothetical protein
MNWRKRGVVAVLLLGVGCGSQKGEPVSQENFGDDWPLTVPSGRLSCVIHPGQKQVVTFITPDNKKYALNGNANSSNYFLPIDSIQKPDPANPPLKKILVC